MTESNIIQIPIEQKRKKVVDYMLACFEKPDDVVSYVKNGLKLGWQPIGGIASIGGWFLQALVMYEGEDLREKKPEEKGENK